jgi:carboxylesterase
VALDPRTAPWSLGPSSADAGGLVLLLHGFTGSPWEVRPLGEALAARGFHVAAPLLPGHGGAPEALLTVTFQDWLRAADEALGALAASGRPVALVGLSMGGLLALLLAARRPPQVQGLVLLAPAARLRPWNARLLQALRRTPLRRAFPRWVPKRTTDLSLPEVRAEAPRLARYPLDRVLDLFTLQDLAFEAAPRVRSPALVLAAANDHVVALAGIEELARRLPRARLEVLQRGWHVIPRDEDRALAATLTADFLDGLEPDEDATARPSRGRRG